MSKCSLFFYGKLFDNKRPIYVGLYVDDIIYYSKDPTVESHFEKEIATKATKIELLGKHHIFWDSSLNGLNIMIVN